jgi:ribosome biogenesis GTPase
MLEGIVYKSTGSFYSVKDEFGHFWVCRVKGKLRIDKNIKSTNPIAVGDTVIFEIENEESKKGVIKTIKERHNYIVRVSPHNKNHKHIIASNLDQAIIIATITDPKTSLGFIDRFLLTTELYHIPALIVFNKKDLIDAYGLIDELEYIKSLYHQAGYETLETSSITSNGMDVLKNKLQGKTSLFTGHSGVGKSTIVNSLDADIDARVGEISDWTGKGQHTTTFAEMFDLNQNTKIIDTPGIKEFGLIDVTKAEVKEYFPEMRALQHDCKFNNCMHINEPGCAVKHAIGTDALSEERYISYLGILDNITENLY